MTYNEVMKRVNELKADVESGATPTWYAYQEIDRLMATLTTQVS